MRPALKILETEKKVDPRRHLIKLFNDAYLEMTKAENPLPYGACMKAMQGFFKFVDEESGEIVIEYPSEEAWIGQIEGLKRDKFSLENRLCGFPYFLKRFGSFRPVSSKALRRAGFKCNCGKEFWTAEEYNKHTCKETL
jgi:hypothetical protein